MKPDLIIVSDLHLREDTPLCRTDDFWNAQERKVEWICNLRDKYDCPIVCAGDVFDHWKPSPYLLSWAIEKLPPMFVVAGQHDLPNHNMDLIHKSGLSVLQAAGRIELLTSKSAIVPSLPGSGIILIGVSYGELIPDMSYAEDGTYVLITHRMTWTKKVPFPGCEADSATKLLKKAKGFSLVVTGDNHQTFITTDKNDRWLINPGSMMRTTAAQVDHEPCVYLWEAKTNKSKREYFPIEEDVISREHIDRKADRDERVEAFVDRLDETVDIGLSFEKNLEEYFAKNRTKKRVKDLIWEGVEG